MKMQKSSKGFIIALIIVAALSTIYFPIEYYRYTVESIINFAIESNAETIIFKETVTGLVLPEEITSKGPSAALEEIKVGNAKVIVPEKDKKTFTIEYRFESCRKKAPVMREKDIPDFVFQNIAEKLKVMGWGANEAKDCDGLPIWYFTNLPPQGNN